MMTDQANYRGITLHTKSQSQVVEDAVVGVVDLQSAQSPLLLSDAIHQVFPVLRLPLRPGRQG